MPLNAKLPRKTVILHVVTLIAALVFGCSDEPNEMADIDATVEARVSQRLGTQAAPEAAEPAAIHTQNPSPLPLVISAHVPSPMPQPTATMPSTPTPDIQSMISAVLTAIPPTETPTPDFQATAEVLATITAPTLTSTPLPSPSPTRTPVPNFAAIAAALRPSATPTSSRNLAVVGPVSTPMPSAQNLELVQPSGSLVIAVDGIGVPSGLPRFCSKSAGGCSEIVYLSGMTETLFNSALDDKGLPTTEAMLATDFTLDPSLEYGDFRLREGVQFHNGWGEMTSEDVAFSYNDANSVTNPESVHGQAGDFAPLIASMDPIDPYTVRLQYRNYDSRGVLHRFSRFWQTAGIVSKRVFDEKGIEGMQRTFVGVGAFEVNEPQDTEGWVQQRHIKLTAYPDYYARGEDNIGPFVQELEWRDVPAGDSRKAALEVGETQIAQVNLSDIPNLLSQGFAAQQGGVHNTMLNIALGAGNYWEEFGALTGEHLERDRETEGYPYIGNPFENGAYDEKTPSMQSSKLVRNALAWGIERDDLVENIISGLGVVNHQPYLSINNPSYQDEWSWGTDFGAGKFALTELGYSGGFEIDLWTGTNELNDAVGEAVGASWRDILDVKVNLIRTEYDTFRPGLVARTNKTPFIGCDRENHSNFPFDWAHGFVMSSISAGGYGVGMEVPWAAQTYLRMAGEPDKAKREELATAFYTNNREWAMCVGLFEYPIWPVYNPDEIEAWDQRPIALTNLGGINNVRTIRLR